VKGHDFYPGPQQAPLFAVGGVVSRAEAGFRLRLQTLNKTFSALPKAGAQLLIWERSAS